MCRRVMAETRVTGTPGSRSFPNEDRSVAVTSPRAVAFFVSEGSAHACWSAYCRRLVARPTGRRLSRAEASCRAAGAREERSEAEGAARRSALEVGARLPPVECG